LDDLIAQKQRGSSTIKEKRQALITQAVTKGLNPAKIGFGCRMARRIPGLGESVL
jgi:hypothetical protein